MTTWRGSDGPLLGGHDVALCDCDGVLYLGDEPVGWAAEAVREARAGGLRWAFVTNNASRSAEQVARHLQGVGIPATADDVVTSAMALVGLLQLRLEPGARVLVAGAAPLVASVAEAGFAVVGSADDAPAAVAVGYDPLLDYPRLAEAALAIGRGAVWLASNDDATLPTPRGPLPGMGSVIALLSTATGRRPEIAGKPHPALHAESVRRTGAQSPLVVGDRLDTDVAGAVRAGVPSLLVLTGVTSARDVLAAPPERRPTYLSADLRGVLEPHPSATAGRCRDATATVAGDRLVVRGGTWSDRVRAAASLAWDYADQHREPPWGAEGLDLDEPDSGAA